jgi:hypothetical protein
MCNLDRTRLTDLGLRNRGTFLEANFPRPSDPRELLPGYPPSAPDPTVARRKKNPGGPEGLKTKMMIVLYRNVLFVRYYYTKMCFPRAVQLVGK